ncbi:MAG: glycosyltransferase family 4 protein [Woeseiaceae bacterium]
MKVLHDNFGKGFRGGQRQTELLIRALAEQQLPQGILLRRDSPLIERLQDLADLKILKSRKPYIQNRISAGEFDFCHAHETKAAQWAYMNKLLCKTPYVITRRVPRVPNNDWFTRSVYTNAATTICLSTEIRDNLLGIAPAASTHSIPDMCAGLPVDERLLRHLKEQYRGKYVVGTVGALIKKHKGHHVLLETLRELQSDTDLHCLIVGDGYDRQELEQQAEGLSNVEFLGFRSEVGTYLRLFDLFAFPSLEEGFGSTLLDAMQAGCPIVASNVGGIPEIVSHEQNGLLVQPGDATALRNAITRLRGSPELAQRLVNSGKERANSYLPERLAIDHLELYQSLFKNRAD